MDDFGSTVRGLFVIAAALLVCAPFGQAASAPPILPATIGAWQKEMPALAAVHDPKVWQEYGLQASETAEYVDGAKKFSMSAYRFPDATGAFAAWQEIAPENAKPVALSSGLGAADAKQEVVQVGNYLFVFDDYRPKPEELNHIVGTVPLYDQSPLPTLPRYMPPGVDPNSERYITGPDSLARFAPQIPPSTAAFHFNAEAELGKYGPPGKQTTLVIFTYPTMEMARDRIGHFEQIPGAVAKRSGPLVAVALNPATPDEAERLLAKVRYEAEVTVPEHVPTLKDNPANLFLNIVILCLILAGFCVVSGLVVGGLRILLRRAGASGEGDNMISLHLSGRQ